MTIQFAIDVARQVRQFPKDTKLVALIAALSTLERTPDVSRAHGLKITHVGDTDVYMLAVAGFIVTFVKSNNDLFITDIVEGTA